ncbi:MAG TPA: hypothetical protein VK506_00440 [Conexibacter sp.]|nr:hypothetical protein [Conexibacter sp.]
MDGKAQACISTADCQHWLPDVIDREPEELWCLPHGNELPCAACDRASAERPVRSIVDAGSAGLVEIMADAGWGLPWIFLLGLLTGVVLMIAVGRSRDRRSRPWQHGRVQRLSEPRAVAQQIDERGRRRQVQRARVRGRLPGDRRVERARRLRKRPHAGAFLLSGRMRVAPAGGSAAVAWPSRDPNPAVVSCIDTRYSRGMQAANLLPLLALLRRGRDARWTVRSLAAELRMPPAAVQRSLARLGETPVYDAARRRVDRSSAIELLEHALPFVAPVRLGAPTRGVRTAWAAPVLSGRFAPTDELPPVWPAPEGDVRGLSVAPLHPAAVEIARGDPWMYEMLALVDGVRLGDVRVRGVARELLHERLAQAAAE